MPLAKEPVSEKYDFRLRFTGLPHCCGFAEVTGHSPYVGQITDEVYGYGRYNVTLYDLVYQMTDYDGCPKDRKDGFYGTDYQFKHLIATWNPHMDDKYLSGDAKDRMKKENEEFIEELEKAGWKVTKGDKGAHGGTMYWAIITPSDRINYISKEKEEKKCKAESKSTGKATQKSKIG